MSKRSHQAVIKIIEEMDKSILLGAAYDCMSDVEKSFFVNKLEKIIELEQTKDVVKCEWSTKKNHET